jgi:hypothetical protein
MDKRMIDFKIEKKFFRDCKNTKSRERGGGKIPLLILSSA